MNEKAKFLKDYRRMCNSIDCDAHCDILSVMHEMSDIKDCSVFILKYPEKAVELIEKWSKEHPERTYLTDFLEKYPNARMRENGYPIICPISLGYTKKCPHNCKDCWNTPVKE